MLKSKQNVFRIIIKNRDQLSAYGARSIAIFGSIARGEAKNKSDIDILVNFDAQKGLFAFLTLKQYLENILHRKVDLITYTALHPKLRKNILKEAINAY